MIPVFFSCPKDQALADAAFEEPDSSGVGWIWMDDNALTCMQGSWRQVYTLENLCEPCDSEWLADSHTAGWWHGHTCEEIWEGSRGGSGSNIELTDDYQLRVCQETAEFNYMPGEVHSWSQRANGLGGDVLYANRTFIAAHCYKCLRPTRLWFDSFYWSLTTITTIGYGDRGPQTEVELIFVMFSELFGLAFFAILLTQINTVNEVLSQEQQSLNDQKNGVVQFLRYHELGSELVKDSVRFLNFRTNALSGSQFEEDDPRFAILSPGIRLKIRRKMTRPVLTKVRVFGWNDTDHTEETTLRNLFDEIDTTNSEHLTSTEMRKLFSNLNLELNDDQFEDLFDEMDSSNTGQIDYHEFRRWWYVKKTGMPHMERCPEAFLNILAEKLHCQARHTIDCLLSSYAHCSHPNTGLHSVVICHNCARSRALVHSCI